MGLYAVHSIVCRLIYSISRLRRDDTNIIPLKCPSTIIFTLRYKTDLSVFSAYFLINRKLFLPEPIHSERMQTALYWFWNNGNNNDVIGF